MAKQDRTTLRRKPPVTKHPLFPAIVALWLGALFGLGSLAIRSSLIEGAVLATGIDTILSAAAPPLGVTARVLLALALGGLGALIGGYGARFLVRAAVKDTPHNHTVASEVKLRTRDAHPDAPARRPISALEELGEDQIDTAPQTAAPVLTGRRRALTLQEDHSIAGYHDPAPLPGGTPQVFHLAADEFGEIIEVEYEAEAEFGAPIAEQSTTPPTAAERIANAPLDDLGMLELAERLGRAMVRRRQLAADTAPITLPHLSGAALEKASFDPFAGEIESPFAALAPKTAPGEVGVVLRPLSFDPHEDEALPDVLDGLLPPRRIKVPALPIPPVDEPDELEFEEVSAPDAYPSLLDVSRPAALRRSDAPMGAMHPISGSPPSPVMNDPEETERALRSALATLQRMSGAA